MDPDRFRIQGTVLRCRIERRWSLKITKDDVAVAVAAAKEDTGLSLTSVRVLPGRLVATDGRVLVLREVEMEEDEPHFEPFNVSAKALKDVARKGGFIRPGENGSAVILSGTMSNGRLIPNGTETTIQKVEGSYPDYMRVLPDADRDEEVAVDLNPTILMRLLKAFKGVSLIKLRVVPKGALRLEGKSADGLTVLGAIMPIVRR
jgi:DNA polymerase III sliding clamp (beta) subunit (PCNA family)